MGLFSTLGEGGPKASSSATVPTVIQLYSAGTKPIQLDSTARVSGYTALTYQAIQVGSSAEVEPKNRHQNPDLGIWNCAVRKQTTTTTGASTAAAGTAYGGTAEDAGAADDNAPQASAPTPLVDHLLSKVTTGVSTFCLSVDLTEEETVEPTVALLQEALVRHLIENPPSQSSAGAGEGTGMEGGEDANPEGNPAGASTATTSLHELKSTTFGLADEDKSPKKGQTASSETEEEKDKNIKTSLMICALLPVSTGEEASEVAYRKKQARALVIYHLRKFAATLNAALLFVNKQDPSSTDPANNPAASVPSTPTAGGGTGGDEGESSSTPNQEQPTVSVDVVSKLWRDYAMGEHVWMTSSHGDATVVEASTEGGGDVTDAAKDASENVSVTVHSTPLYGPGYHQEDLIATVLLRNAHCPGHWDASKDSLWVALPLVIDEKPETPLNTSGDEGWLSQLRSSIASAEPVKAATPDKPKEETPKKKDEAVSSFFESLLKNP